MRNMEQGPIGRTAAALAMVAGVGIATPNIASELQPHHISASGWTVLGGDPLINGGVHSISQAEGLIDSNLGHQVLQREGLSSSEIQAVQTDARKNQVRGCTMNFGEKFIAMVFGPGGNEIDYNVAFADPRFKNGAPAYCVDAKIVNTTKSEKFIKNQAGAVTEEVINIDQKIDQIDILIPQKCGNIALQKIESEHKTKKIIVIVPPTTTTTTTTTTVPPTTTTTTTIYVPTTTISKGIDPGIGG